MTERKLMDINEFREEGFLQEANRKFFHPLGLALEVVTDPEGNSALAGVWDFRSDKEGIFFAADVIDEDKVANVEKLRKAKVAARKILAKNVPEIVINNFGVQTK